MKTILLSNNQELPALLDQWEPRLLALPSDTIANRRNKQNRTIKQIMGHLVDSASNNTHRIVHFQYQATPMVFPDYANLGNNDRWITIQDYQHEDWHSLVQLWKYTNLHIVHVFNHIDESKLDHVWVSALNKQITMRDMITSYLGHVKLHLSEIEELIQMD
ncbi:MAG: hypothetical protein QM786_14225 [Breznakibacter sp.]